MGKGDQYEDNCLNVFQYFNTSCFKGYGDDREVISISFVSSMDSESCLLYLYKSLTYLVCLLKMN